MLALPAALVVALVACGPDPGGPPGVGIVNSTGETIRISYVVDGIEQAIPENGGTVEVSRTTTFRLDLFDPGNPYHCTTGDIVVRSLDGEELDRFPPPVCDGRVLPALDRRSPAG